MRGWRRLDEIDNVVCNRVCWTHIDGLAFKEDQVISTTNVRLTGRSISGARNSESDPTRSWLSKDCWWILRLEQWLSGHWVPFLRPCTPIFVLRKTWEGVISSMSWWNRLRFYQGTFSGEKSTWIEPLFVSLLNEVSDKSEYVEDTVGLLGWTGMGSVISPPVKLKSRLEIVCASWQKGALLFSTSSNSRRLVYPMIIFLARKKNLSYSVKTRVSPLSPLEAEQDLGLRPVCRYSGKPTGMFSLGHSLYETHPFYLLNLKIG